MNVKSRMAEIGMTQVDMMLELQKRGYSVQPPMMSSILRGFIPTPRQSRFLQSARRFLKNVRRNEPVKTTGE